MRHFVFVTLCGWLSGMQGIPFTLLTRQSLTQSDKYQVSHRCSYFSCWWAHSWPKHVEKRNKHTKKNCAPSWLYLQDYTRTNGQQNIKKELYIICTDCSLKFLHMALICQVRYKRINQSLCVLNIYITNKHKTLLAVGEFCCCKTKKSKSPGISGTSQQPSMIQALIRGREG